MTKTVADIAVSVTADIGPLVTGLARAQAATGKFERAMKTVGSRMQAVGASAYALGTRMSIVSAAMGAVTAAAFALTRQGAELGDAIDNASRAAGLAPGYFQEMQYAIGEVADISDEDFNAAMVRLNRTLGEAKAGSTSAAKAMEAIGISAADIASGSVTTQQALDAYLVTMGEITDPALAAAVSADLFGKAGARMGGLMAGASGQVADLRDRARELGVVMSDDAVAASAQFDDKMRELAKQFDAVKIAIATVLLPVMVNELIPALQDQVIPAMVAVIQQVGELIKAFQQLPAPVQAAAGVLAAVFAIGGPVLVGIGLVASALAAGGPLLVGIAAFTAGAGLSLAAWVAWGDQIGPVIARAVGFIIGQFNGLLLVLDKIKAAITWIKDAASTLQYQPAGAGGFAPDDNANLPQVQGYGDAILNGGSAGADELGTNIGNSVAQAARDALGIQSPSTVFAEIGADIGAGLAQGIASSQQVVTDAVQVMGQGAVQATDSMASQMLGILGQMFQGSKEIAAAQALVNAWAGASEALKLPFPSNLLAFGKVLATGMSAVRSIQSASPGKGGGGSSSGGVASAAAPTYSANVTLVGDSFTGDSVAELFRQLNEGLGRGFNINLARS
jgi:hypothetical protein